eukprot:Skav218687  [mRNA]  locus=scaffold4775:40329:40934:+ [translate_table: standard]
MLKELLQSSEALPDNFRRAPINALRLILGTEVLRDDVRLSETDLADGGQLSVTLSFAPQGSYVCANVGFDSDHWFNVKADFGDDGTFDITVHEGELIPGDTYEEYPDYDEYEHGAKWDHHYQGTVQMDGLSDFRMTINTLDRKGVFHDAISMCPGTGLRGKLCDDCNQVSIHLPFIDGSWQWVSLEKRPGVLWYGNEPALF